VNVELVLLLPHEYERADKVDENGGGGVEIEHRARYTVQRHTAYCKYRQHESSMPIRFRHYGIKDEKDGSLHKEHEGVIRSRQAGG